MDSLFANYASSDDEIEDSKPQNLPSIPPKPVVGHRSDGDQEESKPTNSHPKSSSSLFGTLPPPKSSSSSSLFSSIPAPKSGNSVPAPQLSELTSSRPATKKVVQFKPPSIGLSLNSVNADDEDDDEDEDKKKKQKVNTEITTVKSLFSSMPAPKNSGSLGALPSASGSNRRSMLEADVPAKSDSNLVSTDNSHISTYNQSSVDANAFSGYAGSSDHSHLASGGEDYAGYEAGGWNGGSGDYGNYGSGYENNAAYDYVQPASSVPSFDIPVTISGRRGRNEIPTDIIEVNQDDLMKNRPREDKSKASGIAFGPSYQPVSAKGKPSKLLKRKHQIGSLYFDMKQNETLLQERRSKGMLTKAQTHAKYGWA